MEEQVIIAIGYHKFIMERTAGMSLFQALIGKVVYKYDTKYEQVAGNYTNVPYVTNLDQDAMPTLQVMNPVIFLSGIENQKAAEAKDKK